MSAQRRLTTEEQAELDALNAAIKTAIETRRAWLDAKMAEISRLKVGDEIFDLDTGRSLGKVTRPYRFWAGRDDLLDDSVSCNYEYETSRGNIDNTSRQIGLRYGTAEDAREEIARKSAAMRGK